MLGLELGAPDRPAVCVTSEVIRDLQRFSMDNREIGTSFRKQSTGEL